MTTAMTERDKKLLYMLGFIVIIFLFVIIADRPLFRKIRTTNKEIEEQQEIHDTIEMKIERMEVVENYRDQIEKRVDKYAERYYPMMDSTQIDDLLTGYVLERGLKAVDLYIDMPDDTVILLPYKYSEAYREAEENGAADAGSVQMDPDYAKVEAFTDTLQNGTAPDIEETADQVYDTALSGVRAAEVKLKAYGREESLKALCDKLYENQSIRVVDYSWSDIPGAGFSYVDGQLVELAETDRQLDISLQVLMYDEDAFVETISVYPDEEDQ